MRDVAYWPKTFLDEIEAKTVDNGILFWALGGAELRLPHAGNDDLDRSLLLRHA